MIQFILQEYALRWERIQDAEKAFMHCAGSPKGHEHLKPEDFRFLASVKSDLGYICHVLELEHTDTGSLLAGFENITEHKPCSFQTVNALLEEIVNAIRRDTGDLRFAFIPKGKVQFFDKGKNEPFCIDEPLFGENVYEKFLSARQEIKSGGTCLAMDLHDAAVFHFMRAANIGARALARSLGIERVGDKELEYCRDETIFTEIDKAIVEKKKQLDAGTRNAEWDAESSYYRGLLDDLRYFKDEYRDPVAHARKICASDETLTAYRHVKDFMQRLAVKISE